jgi:hypothetical protein
MILKEYVLDLQKYNVIRDYEEQKKKHLLYLYKKQVLLSNGFKDLAERLQNTSPQFQKLKFDSEGFEEAVDVTDIYPAESELDEIKKTLNNIQFLRQTQHTYDYCRTRCKITDQRLLRNFPSHPKDRQMCLTDCLNIRSELFTESKKAEKTFVWLA